jgi:hypothetical protein
MDPIKVVGVWAVGLAVLLGTTGVSLAQLPKRPGQTWCACTCDTNPGDPNDCGECKVLNWEMTYHCAVNGRRCTANGKPGRLTDCNQCVVNQDLALGPCSPAKPSVAPPRPPPPKVPPTGPRNPPGTTKGG